MRVPPMLCKPHRVPDCPQCMKGLTMAGKCEHGLTTAECLVCASPKHGAPPAACVPDEWLVKVRRLVQGFEHVSGLARLWEPDYSSGSERALWARATEACADVVKLLNETKKA